MLRPAQVLGECSPSGYRARGLRVCGVRRLAAAVRRTGLPGRAPRICRSLGSGEASLARIQRERAPALHM